MNLKKSLLTKRKDLTRQINNAKRRLKGLKERRTRCPEVREALESAPLAQGEMLFTAGLDEEIRKAEQLIADLKEKRARFK